MAVEVPAHDSVSSADAVESAKAAGLRYYLDERPGIRRVRAGRGFRYRGLEGQNINDPETIGRIKSLAIPPAWTEVWISPRADGHLQATGRDARGRKQYFYHPRWREVRDEDKYERMTAFVQALPGIRARVAEDLARKGLPRERVLAAVVRLLETTLIRVGNAEYARENHSFGLTTMRDKHAETNGRSIHFRFQGKSGKWHEVGVNDHRLARIVAGCQDLPGEELFQYLGEDGRPRPIDSADVNEYLREITGQDFTAKDFRTWAGTLLAARALQEFEAFDSQTQAKRNVMHAIETVAKRLCNTKTVCRKCYVHPAVVDAYLDGSLAHSLALRAEAELEESLHELSPEEAAVLAFVRQRLARDAAGAA